jgi:hypothetical protein
MSRSPLHLIGDALLFMDNGLSYQALRWDSMRFRIGHLHLICIPHIKKMLAVLPQATQSHGRTEFKRSRVLVTSYVEGLLFVRVVERKQQGSLEPL